MEGRTKTEVARDAILYYMKTKEAERLDEHQAAIEKRFSQNGESVSGVVSEVRRRHLRAGASVLDKKRMTILERNFFMSAM